MSKSKRYDDLSEEQQEELNRIRDRFLQSLQGNDGPTIENLIAAAAVDLQRPLFLELLDIDIESRAQRNEFPNADEYLARFLDRRADIENAFIEFAGRSGSERDETQFHDSGNQESSDERTTDLPGIATGVRIGPYTLLRPIGEGGMGSVWMAKQTTPVRRTVALKIIKAGMDTREVIARFEAERQALALMSHPSIAKVLDAGATETGRPYFVMELVKGIPITRFCDKHHLAAEARLKLFVTVCHAVQHAHQKGIIHRDIKPSNVLAMMQDGHPVVKVIDFGLAKATGQQLTEKTLFTAYGQMVGTPAYMSPEQAEVGGLDIDTRTDVYSLGVLLYELLTGVTPIDLAELRSAGYAEMQRLVREQEPPRMSLRLSSLGDDSQLTVDNRSTDSKRLSQLLRGDLDLIAMKALEKDRERRYETPSNFAADIDRFLKHEAIEARPASASYRLQKLFRRNKTAVLTTAVVALSLLLGTVISTWQAIRATNARDAEMAQRAVADNALIAEQNANEIAQKRLGQLEKVNVVFASIFRELDPNEEEKGGLPILAQLGKRIDEATVLVDGDAIGDPLMVADLQLTLAGTQRQLSAYDKAQMLAEKALATREAELGSDHVDTLQAAHVLGVVFESSGKFPEAINHLERAYEKRKELLGPDNLETLETQSILAGTLGNAGQRKKGLELQNDAFEKIQRIQGANHSQTVDCLNRLAKQTWDFGEDEDLAEELWDDLLIRRRAELGDDHYKTNSTAGSVAVVKMSRGKFENAREILEKTLEQVRERVGPNHLATIRIAGNLAYCYLDSGKVDEGLKLLEETLQRFTEKLGEDHPTTMIYMNNLAYSYEQHDQLDNAIKAHRRALAQRLKNLGANHQDTLTSMSNLAWTLRRKGQFAESIGHYRTAVIGWKENVAKHPETLGCMNNFAWSLTQGKEFAEAETVLKECLPLQQEKYPDGWKTFRAQFWLGVAMLEQNKYDEAEPELLAGYQGMKTREANMSDNSKIHIVEAIEALIRLYSARAADGDDASTEKWKALLQTEKDHQN